jgi:hypothetical protein
VERSEKEREIILLFLGVLATVSIYYYKHTVKWWIADDPAILKFAAKYPFHQIFFCPQVWRRFSPSNLTPMVLLSFKTDLWLFGLKPGLFYLHQVTMAALSAAAFYLLLAEHVDTLFAAAASIFFMLSPAVSQSVNLLMTRHYLEGLFFCLLSMLLFSRHIKSGEKPLLFASVVCYAVASSCKEIFVPLPLVLVLWPQKPVKEKAPPWEELRRRIWINLPFFLWLGIYTSYRRWMLGRFLGGYGSLANSSDLKLLAKSTYKGLFLADHRMALIVAILTAVSLLAMARSPKAAVFMGSILVCVFAPLLAISKLAERQLLLPVLLVSALIAFGMDRIWRKESPIFKAVSVAAMAMLILLALPLQAKAYSSQRPFLLSFEETGRFLWHTSTPKDAVINPAIPNWYHKGLAWLKEEVAKGGAMGHVINNLCYATALGGYKEGYRLWEYKAALQRVVRLQKREVERRIERCRKLFRKRRIFGCIWEEKNNLHWRFGPYSSGRYLLVDRETGYSFTLTKEGSFPATLDSLSLDPPKLAICYEDKAGWRCCTTPKITKTLPPAKWFRQSER